MNITNQKTGPLDRLITHMAQASLPWVPEAFHARFPVSVKSSVKSSVKPEVFSRGFAVRVFGRRSNTCRPAADETKLPDAREKKVLLPRGKRL